MRRNKFKMHNKGEGMLMIPNEGIDITKIDGSGTDSMEVEAAAKTQFTGINDSLKRVYGDEQRKAFCYSQFESMEYELKEALKRLDNFGNAG